MQCLAACAAGAIGCGSLTNPESGAWLAPQDMSGSADGAAFASTPLDPNDLDAPSLDQGLHVGGVTNFEFERLELANPFGVEAFADARSQVNPHWSTVTPISGKADLRLDFTFNRGPEPFDEWVGLCIWGPTADLRGHSTVVLALQSDKPRLVRMSVQSRAYAELFGGILQEFNVELSVWPEARAIAIDLLDFSYPFWARGLWTGGTGFGGDDAEALRQVLGRFTGICFTPDATLDAEGELTEPAEPGYLRIDNIYFL